MSVSLYCCVEDGPRDFTGISFRGRKVLVMSLLDLCPDGNLLEDARPREAPPDPTAAEALREKLLASALPTQREFLEDTDHRIIGFVAGFGAGKTLLCLKTIMLALDNVGYVGLVAEPTYRSFGTFSSQL